MGKDFYYIGNLRPANLEPLMAPLCRHLDIRGKDSELFVLMIEDNDGVKAYLKEKGYNVDLIREDIVVGSEKVFNPTLNYIPSVSQEEPRCHHRPHRGRFAGRKGEIRQMARAANTPASVVKSSPRSKPSWAFPKLSAATQIRKTKFFTESRFSGDF